MRRIKIFDTTLRDGEQAAHGAMTFEEKMEVGLQLERLGVDCIEAGFPATSPGDFRAVEAMCEQIKDCQVAALSDAKLPNIETTGAALKKAVAPRLHTVLSTSDIHLKHQLRISREQALEMAVAAVRLGRNLIPEVEFSAMDAARSDWDYLCRVFEATIDAGATIINIPDTLGYMQPPEFAELVRYVVEHVPNIGKAAVSVHCHNDLGMATGLSLAAIKVGAEWVECTVNGVGERAGNASMEEIVMSLKTRADYYGAETGIRTDQIWRTSRMVAQYMGFPVQPNKAIVGSNAFSHSSGLHQDGMLKERITYEIMTPESIGRTDSRLILSKHSGRNAFRAHIKELGYALDDGEFARAFRAFKEVADKKKDVTDADIQAVIADQVLTVEETYRLEALQVSCGEPSIPTATVRVAVAGEGTKQDASTGDGPVDAVCKAIDRITGLSTRLSAFSVQSVSSGMDALGEVSVKVESATGTFIGRGASTDIIVASGRAYLNALNKVAAARREHAGAVSNGTNDANGVVTSAAAREAVPV
jgi:2-isopropylmalate synthase